MVQHLERDPDEIDVVRRHGARRFAPTAWTVVVALVVAAPLVALGGLPAAELRGPWRFASLVAAFVATSLVLVVAALPSRLRVLTSALGVERLLRQHRALALVAVGLVLAHVAFVLLHSSNGLAVLDLSTAPPRVWAATIATLALLLLVASGLSRRRRRPRYEGWRLAHVLLANVALVASALHVYWLADLTAYPAVRAWFAALVGSLVVLLAYRWVWRPMRSRRNLYVVEQVREETPSMVTVVVRAVGHRGLRFRPGQFVWMKIGESPFVFEEHPFTIASTATRPWRKEFTIKALGDFTEIVAGLRPGRRIHLDGPHGSFTVDGIRTGGFVFIAGGVGITPMLSMVRTLAARRDPRPMVLIVAGRTADELLHVHEHEEWARVLDISTVEVLEEPPEEWEGHVGWLREEVLGAALPQRRSRWHRDYFICGPGPMVAATTRVLGDWGVSASRVHTELFDVV